MLRLVVNAWFTAPTDEQEKGSTVDISIDDRQQRVDDVSQSRVLQIHQRNLARGQMVADAEGDRCSFISGDDVPAVGGMLGNVSAKGLKQRVWYTRKELYSIALELLDERYWAQHCFTLCPESAAESGEWTCNAFRTPAPCNARGWLRPFSPCSDRPTAACGSRRSRRLSPPP